MRFYLFAILSLVAVTAHGQSIFKCKQQDGSTSYQDHPCPGAPNDRPAMTIKPSAEESARQSQQHLTPQQRAKLEQALRRLQFDLQAIQAKRGQAVPQGGTPNTH